MLPLDLLCTEHRIEEPDVALGSLASDDGATSMRKRYELVRAYEHELQVLDSLHDIDTKRKMQKDDRRE